MLRHSTPQKRGSAGALRMAHPGSITWKFKTLSGVSVSNGYTPTEITAIKEKNGNVVVSQGGILHTTDRNRSSRASFIDVKKDP